ncbi:DUF3267 domain-containing protein [Lentibacillus amyloliquefaciens]|uniref:Zincin peptidase n=1 Tax=Lentibacillus amyloliquefaciens TaxID=1472767 RepID=A0A0U3W6A5_9BACI|nr:DUF3267 domain-containing protein [Lentibacillus amyloliquefaciens]ALX48706.1 hypothetical protein AOX59_08815 [Lentibacillus amyloliquefaciens]
MNCWQIINFNKEFGINRLYLQSFLVGLLSFIILYIPFSIRHGTSGIDETGVIPLVIGLCLLPILHSFTHILPLIVMNKQARLIYKRNTLLFPIVNYYTKKYLSKKVSLFAAMAPTLLITIPSVAATFLFSDFYVYFLIFTSVHTALTFTDFLYIRYIVKAPKSSYIENSNNEITILVNKDNKSAI